MEFTQGCPPSNWRFQALTLKAGDFQTVDAATRTVSVEI